METINHHIEILKEIKTNETLNLSWTSGEYESGLECESGQRTVVLSGAEIYSNNLLYASSERNPTIYILSRV
jgi:hypothetical protein